MDQKEYDAIIALAIAAEVDAQKFYTDLAERMTDVHLKNMFLEFIEEEKKHEKILTGFRSKDSGHIHFIGAPDFKVSETVEKPVVSSKMKPADAIALAMKNEQDAMNNYNKMADSCLDSEQKQIFHELAAMEREHKNKMERAFVDIGYPEVW